MKRILSTACLIAVSVVLAGCPKKATTVQPPTAGSQVGGGAGRSSGANGASTNGSAFGNGAGGDNARGLGGDQGGPTDRKIIYFDFDKSEIKPEFAAIVTTAARNLTAHPGSKMKLEGNTDERGTREYNIGLGERRAQAVRRALMLQGVTDTQLSTTSFGSERPTVEGDDEAAWSQNRRVELVYQP